MLKEVFFTLDNNIYALLLLLITSIFAFKNVNKNSKLTKSLKNIVLVVSLELVLESISYLIKISNIIYKKEIINILSSCIYITTLFIPYLFCMFVTYYTNYIRYINIKKNIFITPVILGIFFVIINLFTPILFKVADSGLVEYKPLYIYYFITSIFHAICTICIIFFNIKKLNTKEINALVIFCITIMIGIFLNSFLDIRFLVMPFISLAICIEMFFLKTDLSQYDNVTKLWTREKADKFIQNIIEENKYNLTVLYIDYINIIDVLKEKGEKEIYSDVKKVADILQNICNINSRKVRYDINKFVVIYLNTRKEVIQNEMNKIEKDIKENTNVKIKYIIEEFNKEEQKTKGQFIRFLEVKMNGGDVL